MSFRKNQIVSIYFNEAYDKPDVIGKDAAHSCTREMLRESLEKLSARLGLVRIVEPVDSNGVCGVRPLDRERSDEVHYIAEFWLVGG